MSPKQFTEKIKELAKREYHSCRWERTVFSCGKIEIEIAAYISSYGWTNCYPTAEQVVAEMERTISLKDINSLDSNDS